MTAVEDRRAARRAPLLRVRGACKRLGAVDALIDADLHVDLGEIVALVGENGAGKSTLVRLLGGDLVPDAGELTVDGAELGRTPADVNAQGVAVVWQDVELCEDLDVVGNLYLGRENWLLSPAQMHAAARRHVDALRLDLGRLDRPVRALSGGQRRLLTIARALHDAPRLLILDEPTANLPSALAPAVVDVVRRLRAAGTAVIIVTHRVSEVFALADRIVVMRRGRTVADIRPPETHPDDVVALMSGVESDSTAKRQLRRLRSLGEQLAEVEASGALPLIVAAMADALGVDMVSVHLYEGDGVRPVLRRSAAVGLPPELLAANDVLDVGPSGGSVGLAAERGETVLVEDVREHPRWLPLRQAALASGVRSAWAAPIISNEQTIGTVSGYGDAVGGLTPDQLELVSVYAGYAAAAIEREQALSALRTRNRVLETLGVVLEELAGPARLDEALPAALLALCRGLGAAVVAVYERDDGTASCLAAVDHVGRSTSGVPAVEPLLAGLPASESSPQFLGANAAVRVLGSQVLTAVWPDGAKPGAEALALLDDAGRSLRLALERESLSAAREEAAALRRSSALQSQLLQRLSHELRTPLTAVHGFASTLLQTDVEWDAASTQRFLGTIATESERLRRLVTDLLDASAIESGLLRLDRDWCDVLLVVQAAAKLMPPEANITIHSDERRPQIVWGDHDRLEQVFVNLLHNAVTHTRSGTEIDVDIATREAALVVRVRDRGPGVPREVEATIFDPHVRGSKSAGAGLGLSIAASIVAAHGGTLGLEKGAAGATFVVTLPIEPLPDPAVGGDVAASDASSHV